MFNELKQIWKFDFFIMTYVLYFNCMKSYASLKKELLKDEDVSKAYEALGPEFMVIQKLIDKRLSSGMTQGQLADKIGTKQTAISRFESGKSNPSVGFLYKVADALDAKIHVTVS